MVTYNTTANDVNEQVIKGNIALIKHTDDGETKLETPEVGAEFSVYLKSSGSYDAAKDSERDYLVCDENGFAQTKELPYGIYTVHQVSGWEGRELLADFDVYIAKDGQVYRYLANNANFESYIKVIKVDTAKQMRCNFSALHKLEIRLTPPKMNFFRLTPVSILSMGLSFVFRSKFGNMFMYRHSMKAPDEMRQLHDQFYGYIQRNLA